MFDCAQAQVDALKADGCDYIICLGHLGIDAESTGNRSIDLLEKVTGIDVFIDGHSHSTLEEIKEATNGTGKVGDTVLTSTGTKLANVGMVDISPDGTISTSSLATSELTVTPDAKVAARAEEIQKEIDADYGTVFAKTEVALDGEKANVRTGETNLGDLIADAMLWQAGLLDEGVDAAVTNGGGIRASIAAGDITKKDINTVLPFGNTLYVVKVTGAELLEALEASTYCTPEAIGGFPQVAGIEFTVNTGAQFDTKELYPGSTYGKPASINRVMIQTVGGEAFNPEETYTIVTNDFMGAAVVSANALYAPKKGEDKTLLQDLLDSGAISGSTVVIWDYAPLLFDEDFASFLFYPVDGSPASFTSFKLDKVTVNGLSCQTLQVTTPEEVSAYLASIGYDAGGFGYVEITYDEDKAQAAATEHYTDENGKTYPLLAFSFTYTATQADGSQVKGSFTDNYYLDE